MLTKEPILEEPHNVLRNLLKETSREDVKIIPIHKPGEPAPPLEVESLPLLTHPK